MATAEELYMVGGVNLQSGAVKEAIDCFKEAAEMGHSDSQFMYGYALMGGEGVKKDFDKGFELIQKAANNGSGKAINALGQMGFKKTKDGRWLNATDYAYENNSELKSLVNNIKPSPQKPSASSAPNSGGSSAQSQQSNTKFKCPHCGFVNEKEPIVVMSETNLFHGNLYCKNCHETFKYEK